MFESFHINRPDTGVEKDEEVASEAWMDDPSDLFPGYNTEEFDYDTLAARHGTDYEGLAAGFEDLYVEPGLASLEER